MSIKIVSLVWEYANLAGSDLLVLLALADRGDDLGTNIYPSMAAIAKKARLSTDQARRVVHKLQADGWIEIVCKGGFRHGKNWANEYRINLDRLALPPRTDAGTRVDAGTPTNASTGPRADARTVPAPVQDQPYYNHPIQPSLSGANAPVAPPATPNAKASGKKQRQRQPDPEETKLSDHPAIQAYQRLYARYPTAAQMAIIAAKDPPLDAWIRALGVWIERGLKPTNIEGPLEWAFNPAKMERIHETGGANGVGPPRTKVDRNARSFANIERMIQEQEQSK